MVKTEIAFNFYILIRKARREDGRYEKNIGP